MQELPQKLSELQEQIIEKSLKQSPKEIAEELTLPVREVLDLLSSPMAQTIRDAKLKQANTELQYKRLEKANDIVDRLMAGIEQIVESDPHKWKIQHVKLFELMMKEIPEQVKNIQQINNIQFNQKSAADSNLEDSLDDKMSKLPAELKMQFWADVEDLADKYIREYGAKKIQNNNGFIDGSIVEPS